MHATGTRNGLNAYVPAIVTYILKVSMMIEIQRDENPALFSTALTLKTILFPLCRVFPHL
jgi:hypothetical protein